MDPNTMNRNMMDLPGVLGDPFAAPQPGQHVSVNVAGRVFHTTRGILTKSPFFRYYLSEAGNVDATGSIIVHADPDLFGAILEYLQHGFYPIFLNADKETHDIPRYLACMREARYFHLERLANWIQRACYAEAYLVHVLQRVISHQDPEARDNTGHEVVTYDGNVATIVSWQKRFLLRGKEKVALCRRGIPEHRGQKELCWRECHGARDDPVWVYDEEPSAYLFVTTKTTRIDHGLLRDPDWR